MRAATPGWTYIPTRGRLEGGIAIPPARKRRRRRRDSNFVVLKADASVALSTLLNGVAIPGVLLDLNDDVQVISADINWILRGLTAGEGPIEAGLCTSPMTASLITEALDASPNSRGDRIALERSGRPVRTAGTFPGVAADEVLNDGRPLRSRKLYWKLAGDLNLSMYAVNRGGATLTTGASLIARATIYARWM